MQHRATMSRMGMIRFNVDGRIRIAEYGTNYLRHKIAHMAEVHVPKPFKSVMFAYLLKLGLEAHENGTVLREESLNHEEVYDGFYNFPYFIKESLYIKYRDAYLNHPDPKPVRRFFYIMLLCLGIQEYYEIYTIYGFRKVEK